MTYGFIIIIVIIIICPTVQRVGGIKQKLEKVTTNDVLLVLKFARRDATSSLKSSWGLETPYQLNFGRSIYIGYAAPYLACTVIIASIYGGRVKRRSYFSVYNTKIHKI